MKLLSNKITLAVLGILIMTLTDAVMAATKKVNPLSSSQRIYTPENIHWQPGPNGLPKGVQYAVLEGDPTKVGSYTVRLKFPANYEIPPYTRSAPTHLTVLSGNYYIGFGDKFDKNTFTRMAPGSFVLILPNTAHFAYTPEETIIQLHGTGPWTIKYI